MTVGEDRRARLVVLRALKLGDFLTGLPALRALAKAFPDHRRILAAPSRFAELIGQTDMHAVSHTPDLRPLATDLAAPDVAVDLHGRGPLSQRILLQTGPGQLISFSCEDVPETLGGPRWRADEHEVHRWCRMLQESGIEADPEDILLRAPLVGRVSEAKPTIIHPGAASRSRRWPAERFAAVARSELDEGRPVLVTGATEEVQLARRVAERAGLAPECVLAGRTSLTALAELVAGAGRVVSGDTGIAHLATATATPSVVLFGPVPPAEWGPPDRPHHIALWKGRRGDPHGRITDPGLLEIGVAEVLEALGRLPDARPVASACDAPARPVPARPESAPLRVVSSDRRGFEA